MKSDAKKLLVFSTVLAAVGLMIAFNGGKDAPVEHSGTPQEKTACTASVPSAGKTAVPQIVHEAPVATNSTDCAWSARGTKPFAVRCESGFGKSLRLAVEGLGVRTIGVLSAKELLVEADAGARDRVAADNRFSIREFRPSRKISSVLEEEIRGGAKEVNVFFAALSADDRDAVRARVVARGGEIITGCLIGKSGFCARVPAELVREMAGCGDVRWMEKFERPRIMNDLAVEPEGINVRTVWNTHGLTGAGQLISTSDTGVDTNHLDFAGRIEGICVVDGCFDFDKVGHGTHTAGSLVGSGAESGGQIKGAAWGAKLDVLFCSTESSSVLTPDEAESLFHPTSDRSRIHSASWGSPNSGSYGILCEEMDQYVWEHPDFLPVFSAGNSGPWDGTIGSPASAKNVLAVGATESLRPDEGRDGWWSSGDVTASANFSSRGPCSDGRIKPDVAAPGSAIVSTRAENVNYKYGIYEEFNGKYAYDFGTSMSCPLVAGGVALVREWLVNRPEYSGQTPPTAALMKAIVTGGAKWSSVPDNEFGWGHVDIGESLFPSNRAIRLIDRIPFDEGEVFNYVFETTNAAPFDVQLVWSDYPGDCSSPNKESKLVNDLDLLVVPLDDGGVARLGNGGFEADTINNVESVRIESAPAGRYLVSVVCKRVLYDWLSGGAAALYIRGAFDPEADVADDADRVRIRRTGECFKTLDETFAAAEPGDCIEILAPTRLEKSFSLPFDCTIVATNDNPSVSTVTVFPGAEFSVGANARLLLTNVVFEAGEKRVISVADGGVLAVAGTAAVGLVETGSVSGFELAGPLENQVSVFCGAALESGQTFGVYTCDRATAEACAENILNADDDECIGEATADGTLRWKTIPFDPADAVAIYTDTDGGSETRYLYLHKAFAQHADGGNVEIIKSCKLKHPVELENCTFRLFSETLDEPEISFSGESGAAFTVGSSASLSVSNAVLTGTVAAGAFLVRGGRLALENKSSVQYCSNDDETLTGGAVTVICDEAGNPGLLTMDDGSAILKCISERGGGGGVFLGSGCTFECNAGMIYFCESELFGGNVLAKAGSRLLLSGDPWICGGDSTASGMQYDNIFAETAEIITLTGELSGQVAVRCGGKAEAESDLAGKPFALVACDSASAVKSLKCFESEDFPYNAFADYNSADSTLYWRTKYASQTIVTNTPTPIAIKSIERVSDLEWRLEITNRTPDCEYALAYTDDLSKGFTETGAWEQVFESGQWNTNILFNSEDAKPAFFWKALGRETYIEF